MDREEFLARIVSVLAREVGLPRLRRLNWRAAGLTLEEVEGWIERRQARTAALELRAARAEQATVDRLAALSKLSERDKQALGIG